MDNKFARRLEWELTRACDLQCIHCHNPPGTARPRELETEEALAVASELGRVGCRVVTLAGGEPTLRPDWPQIAQVLSRSAITVQLNTNGQRFGRIEARLARAAGVSAVRLSVDGCAPTPDMLRGRKGAFQRLEIAAAELRDAGVPVTFITTAKMGNGAQIDAPHPAHPCGTPGDNVGLGGHHCSRRCIEDLSGDRAQGSQFGTDKSGPSWRCEAGREVLGLRSDGTITCCLALRNAPGVGSVLHSPLPQLWRAAQRARTQDRDSQGGQGRYFSRSKASDTELMQ